MSTRKGKKADKVKYGTVEIPASEFERKNQKVRITMFVDGDVLDAFKQLAKDKGAKYQTLMNETLRMRACPDPEMERKVLNAIRQLGQRVTRIDNDAEAEAELEQYLDGLDDEPWTKIPAHTTQKRASR